MTSLEVTSGTDGFLIFLNYPMKQGDFKLGTYMEKTNISKI